MADHREHFLILKLPQIPVVFVSAWYTATFKTSIFIAAI